MKRIFLLTGAVVASANLATAQSFQFEAVRIGGEYQYYSEPGFNLTSWEASLDASATFGPSLGVQVGVGYLSEAVSSDPFLLLRNINAFELHGFYEISPNSRFGVLYAYDTYNGGDNLYALEVVNSMGSLRGEARIGYFESDIEPAVLTELQIDYSVSDSITLRGNARNVKYDDGNGFYRLYSIGASANVFDRADIYVDYGWTRNDFGDGSVFDGTLLSAGFSVSFGGGSSDMMFTYSPFY